MFRKYGQLNANSKPSPFNNYDTDAKGYAAMIPEYFVPLYMQKKLWQNVDIELSKQKIQDFLKLTMNHSFPPLMQLVQILLLQRSYPHFQQLSMTTLIIPVLWQTASKNRKDIKYLLYIEG